MSKLFKSAKEQQSCWCLNALPEQVSGKWMHFQICLLLWELQVIRDLLCVGEIAEHFVTVACLKKQQILRENTCVGVFFNKVAGLRAQIWYYNTDDNRVSVISTKWTAEMSNKLKIFHYIGPGWAVLKSFTTIIFYYVE